MVYEVNNVNIRRKNALLVEFLVKLLYLMKLFNLKGSDERLFSRHTIVFEILKRDDFIEEHSVDSFCTANEE